MQTMLAEPTAITAAEPTRESADEGYKQLALAALRLAVEDAKGTGQAARSARAWLACDGLYWFELAGVGVQPAAFRAWLRELPPLAKPPAWRAVLVDLLLWEVMAYGCYRPD